MAHRPTPKSGVLLAGILALGMTLVPGAPVRPLQLELAPEGPPEGLTPSHGEVEVSVIDGVEGGAVVGARVRLFARAHADSDGAKDLHDAPSAVYLADSCVTPRHGACVLKPLAEGEHWILADAPHRARSSHRLVVDGGHAPIRLTLDAERTLMVTVSDEVGAPIEHAEIEVTSGDPLPVGARTVSTGRAVAERLGRGPYIVSARANGYEEQVQRGVREGEEVSFRLRRMGVFVVRVEDEAGHPAPKASVTLTGGELWPPRTTQTGEDGRVRVAGLASGSYALRAQLGDRVSTIEMGVDLGRGDEREVVLRLVQGAWIPVRVIEGEGESSRPIAHARVTLSEEGLSPFPIESVTDVEGRARLGPVPEGRVFVSVQADGFVPLPPAMVPLPISGDFRLAMTRGGVVLGRVLDGRGFPIDGASLEIVGTDLRGAPIVEDPRRMVVQSTHFERALVGPRPLIPAGELGVMPGRLPTMPRSFAPTSLELGHAPKSMATLEPWVSRADGTYRAAPVTPGRLRVIARHPQYVDSTSSMFSLAANGTAEVDVVLRAGGILEGRVLDSSFRPVDRARVTIAATRGSYERTALTASDGTFGFASVLGEVLVTASAPDNDGVVAARALVAIPERARRTVELHFPPPSPPMSIRVVDDRGYPLQSARVNASSLDATMGLVTTVVTNGTGEASIAGGSGVPLRVEVEAHDHRAKVMTIERGTKSTTIALDHADALTGMVRSSRTGLPIDNAEITVVSDLGARRVSTGDGGRFNLGALPAETLHLRVTAPGYAMKRLDSPMASATGRLAVIDLDDEAVIEGVVVDEAGRPIVAARVARDHVPTFVPAHGPVQSTVLTDGAGRFRLGGLTDGRASIEAFAPDFGRGRIDGVKVAAGRTTEGIRLVVHRDGAATDEGESGGVAVTLGERTGDPSEVVIVSVAERSEAERAGLLAGDAIVAIDGKPLDGMAAARAQLSGPAGADVVVSVRRASRTHTFRILREAVRR